MNVQVACLCPGSPHGRDTITLRDTLDFVHGKALRYRVQLLDEDDRNDFSIVLATFTKGYVEMGIESWSLVDEAGKPVPVTRAAIEERLLSKPEQAELVSDVADELYSVAVMRPLMGLASNSSPPSPTGDSTSATTGSEPTPLKPSKRSSTSTTPTDAIATISV